MRWEDIDQQVCSVARTLAVVGDRWSLLILRDAFLGTRRFEQFRSQLQVSRHRLSERLNKLVEFEVLCKEVYQERPLRHEYRLTAKGRDLYPVIMTMADWGDRWCDDGTGAPVIYKHKSCAQHFTPVLSCNVCGEAIQPREVTPELGPGLKTALAEGGGMYPEPSEMVEKLPKLLR